MPRPRIPAGRQAEGRGAAAGGEGWPPDLWLEEERLSCSCVPLRTRDAAIGAGGGCGCWSGDGCLRLLCPPRGVPVTPPGG